MGSVWLLQVLREAGVMHVVMDGLVNVVRVNVVGNSIRRSKLRREISLPLFSSRITFLVSITPIACILSSDVDCGP